MSGIGIRGVMDAVAAAIIANDDVGEHFANFTFTTGNCKVIDEEAFRFTETTEGSPDYCVIIDFGGTRPFGQREFASSSMDYDIYANFYHLVPGSDNYLDAYLKGIDFVDDFIRYVSEWPRLNAQVPGARILGAGTPIPYHRGTHWYVMMDVRVGVVDNIREE